MHETPPKQAILNYASKFIANYLIKEHHPSLGAPSTFISHNSAPGSIFSTDQYGGVDLFDRLHEGKPIDEVMILQIVDGLAHLHQQGLVHRDIKPENMLYNATEDQCKLIDFGFFKLNKHPRHTACN